MRTRSFEGKVAAVTGAGSGIGRALAAGLARRGCHLALADVGEEGLAATAASIQNVKVTTRRLDVTDEGEVRAWADEVVRDHGRVNLVFNNAGISYGATVKGAEEADFRRVLEVDFWGVAHGTRAFLPRLEASGDGHVVNTSSLFGLIAFPGQCAYNSAKFAVRGFTECLQIELAITGAPVNATSVHPGGIKTNIAKAAKTHPSLAELGVDLDKATAEFEKQFRLTSDEAAEIILRGIQRNARRVLVGGDAKIMDWVQRLLPGRYQDVVAAISKRQMAKALAARQPG
ncbi:MAG TPA: SDR family NAD(P)-dependent oxidoreductase [Myxococcaceae bacterium]|nr:SDR family NAD(P)-dependent oxidoreductase [Myxococcaceae bacterium]